MDGPVTTASLVQWEVPAHRPYSRRQQRRFRRHCCSDTLGSIRVPAVAPGVAGLRPSFGRYLDDGIMPLTANKFDEVGPLARSVADLALFDTAVTSERDSSLQHHLRACGVFSERLGP
jgi:hypothetical protein